MSRFGFDSTADEVLADQDLTGRTVFVTGGYSGLGKETARAMAAKGAHVILSGRDATKLSATADDLATVTGAKVDMLVADLGSLASLHTAGKEARARFGSIDILINNAGVMASPMGRTADGFETQFGTNHLGHFALTRELMPLLANGARQRIVNLSSRGHHFGEVDLADPNYERREYDKWQAYGQSKTANIQFTRALEDRFGGKGIHAYAVHPGGIQTNLGRHMTDEDREWMLSRMKKLAEANPTASQQGWKSIPQGAATSVWAATASELDGRGGVYAEDCNVAEMDDANPTGGVRSYALDKDKADRLWTLSEELTGGVFAAT